MKRRDFLKYCGAVGLSFPLGHKALAQETHSPTTILIELQGGNDGLNTVVPYSDERYYDLRPNIGLKQNEVITLNTKLGLHNSLEPLMPLWEQKQFNIMLGVGYQKPNLSHFRSIEIWNTASLSDEYLEIGWMANKLKNRTKNAINGLVLDGQYGPLTGVSNVLQIRNVKRFLKQSKNSNHQQFHQTQNPALNHLLQTQSIIDHSADTLKTQLAPLKTPIKFEKNSFARQMALATQIIQSNLNIPVIKVRLNGFDTHANQQPIQARLLKMLAESLATSAKALQSTGNWHNTTIMTYSEFGRRAKENGSKGTDHGTAAPHFILGGSVQGGFSGKQPSLADLNKNNLKYTTDFKQLFAMAKV